MRCICCLSNKISHRPLGMDGYYLCICCGLIFRSDITEKELRESLTKHYQHDDPYEEVAISKQIFFNSCLKRLASHYKGKMSILDVGCGYGYFLEVASKMGWDVSGVEIVKNAVSGARGRVGGRNVFHGSLRDAGYLDNSFDVVTLWDVLFIFESPFEELRETYRVMKEGGIVGIRVRNVLFQKVLRRVYFLLQRACSLITIQNPTVFHQYCYSKKSLHLLLERAGFANIRVTNSPLSEGDPYGYNEIKSLVRAIKIIIAFVSMCVFSISGGRLVIGPSLLVWAEKMPTSNKKSVGQGYV